MLYSTTFSESLAIYEEKYGTARQAKDDNIILHMRIACRITNATNTQNM
jgi:hypothetical protein